ncbi:MAG: hypothetical protein ABJC04_13540, partial [Verrucomicrobiota bacterium]
MEFTIYDLRFTIYESSGIESMAGVSPAPFTVRSNGQARRLPYVNACRRERAQFEKRFGGNSVKPLRLHHGRER